jgi:hypothetical protein
MFIRKFYDMYNGVKGSQKSYKDIDGDWVEDKCIKPKNNVLEKAVTNVLEFIEQTYPPTDYVVIHICIMLKDALNEHKANK